MSRRKIAIEDSGFLAQLGEEPDYRIATNYGLNPCTVARIRHSLGIPPYKRRLDFDGAIRDYIDGMPVRDICIKYGMATRSLYNALHRRSIPPRRRSKKEV